jgi:hypothetical protein
VIDNKVSLVALISRRLFTAISVLIFCLIVLGLVGDRVLQLSGASWIGAGAQRAPDSAASKVRPPTDNVSQVQDQSTRLEGPPMVFVVIGLGALGGFVGLQRRLKSLPDEDLQLLATSWLYALLSPLVGGVLGLVLYCLFMSGLLAGDLFPKLCPATAESKQEHYADLLACAPQNVAAYAKLFFWSFVAGFSERFVIDIIGKFENQALSVAEKRSG